MTTERKECIVHNRKYLSKFHSNINQLRRTNQYDQTILQKLPKRCCSCYGENSQSTFDLDHLRKLCQEIIESQQPSIISSPPEKPFHHLLLQYPPASTLLQRTYKAGRFVGRNGQHLKVLQQTLNISIQIINRKSNKNLQQLSQKLTEQNEDNSINGLCLFITMKNDNDNIDKIKESIKNQWEKIDVTPRKNRSRKISNSRRNILSSPSIAAAATASTSKDNRWKPKKQNAKDKLKSKQKYSNEQEEQVPPQPLVRPISMPKEIIKYQQTKRQ